MFNSFLHLEASPCFQRQLGGGCRGFSSPRPRMGGWWLVLGPRCLQLQQEAGWGGPGRAPPGSEGARLSRADFLREPVGGAGRGSTEDPALLCFFQEAGIWGKRKPLNWYPKQIPPGRVLASSLLENVGLGPVHPLRPCPLGFQEQVPGHCSGDYRARPEFLGGGPGSVYGRHRAQRLAHSESSQVFSPAST